MLQLLNPVAPFYLFMRDLWSCLPLAVRLFVVMCSGILIFFGVVRSMRGA